MRTQAASLVFGMVTIPVKHTNVISPQEPDLKNLHKKCNTPISHKKWCNECNVELGPDDIVKGVKVNSKTYLPLGTAEFEATKTPRSDVIVITKFVSWVEVPTLLYAKHYHLIPEAKNSDGYALLVAGLNKKNMIGLGSWCPWGKEHPIAVRSLVGGLYLSFLHPLEDLVEPPYDPPPLPGKNTKQMLALAEDLIDRQAGDLQPEDFATHSRVSRQELVDATMTKVENVSPTADLMSMLKLSMGGAKKMVKKGVKA